MWIENKLKELYIKFGEIPNVFCPYDLSDLSDGIIPTITASFAKGYGSRGGVLLNDKYCNGKENKKKYGRSKMNYNLLNFCEFDKYAVKSYCAIHGVDESKNLGDITQVDIESLPTNVDLITHGSPCFTADTLVLTDKGYKQIIDVEIGDMVLDHTLKYNKVVNRFAQGKKEVWEIETNYTPIIRTTSNHRFYVKRDDGTEPKWVECRQLAQNDKLALVQCEEKKQIKWIPIDSITNTHKLENVYDIEVENSHSFTANGVIAHNCQSFSVAGKQHGGEKGSGTRSSLLWNSVEIIKHCKPKFVIWENVKNVLSAKHKPVFDSYVDEMKNSGYNTYYSVLNAKNYGIPQNRERIYAISIREDVDNSPNYTGHIDHNKCCDKSDCSLFPKPFDSRLRLKDFLENEVDEKYYLSDKMIAGFMKHNENHEAKGTGFKRKPRDIDGNASCIRANTALCPTDNTIKQVAQIYPNSGNPEAGRIYDSTGISPSIVTFSMPKVEENFRIRKLTPKECYRLMGFSDEDFDKAASTGNSNTQLYKQAGNSIVVNVLEEIYKCLIKAYPNDFTKDMNVISLFSGIGAFEKALERVDFN